MVAFFAVPPIMNPTRTRSSASSIAVSAPQARACAFGKKAKKQPLI
ncbi:hypothetical protein [Plasticicumulans acidivorans]|nr:hypothetical protein [Plasticicumulans acidivorans]